jgi:DNA-binding CsgD family transcriptional regulator
VPGQLRPVHPDIGLRALLSRQEAEVLERQKQLAEARAEVTRLVDEYAARQRGWCPSDIECLDGIDAVRARIEELTHCCTSSLQAFHPGGAQSASNRAASRPLGAMLAGRGVVMHTVYLDSLYNDPESVDHARWLVDMGNHVRTTASLPFRMLVFDREHALVPIDPDDSARGALLFSSPGVLAGLCALFDFVWEKAVPLSGTRRVRPPADGQELTSQEAAVLRLLGEGCTDEVVARKLGISVRTGRRITADLMGRLGARSRFQAGMRAAQLGWLGADDGGDGPPGVALASTRIDPA